MTDTLAGFFISLEGPDGSGKTTQAELLAPWLAETSDREVVLTREPGGTELGAEVRRLVQHGGDMHPRAEALLYAADRAHHVASVVRPALDRGAVVITDRYLDSSIAYQAGGRELSHDEIRDLSMWAAEGLVPDCTVLLDVDGITASGRQSGQLDRLESAGSEFQMRIREAYLRLAAADPDRWIVVDADDPVDEVQERIRAEVLTHCAWVEAHPRGFSHQTGAGATARWDA